MEEEIKSEEPKLRKRRDQKFLIIFIVIAVLVGGFLYWTILSATKEIEETISKIQETEVKKGIDTSNWKTYVNEGYGYEMEYPEELVVKDENKNYVCFWTQEALSNIEKDKIDFAEFTIKTENNLKRLSIDEWLTEKNSEIGFLYFEKRTKFVTSEGLEGYRLLEEGAPDHYNYYFSKDQKVYIISTPVDNKDKYENVFKHFTFQ